MSTYSYAGVKLGYSRILRADTGNAPRIELMANDISFILFRRNWGNLTFEGAYNRVYATVINCTSAQYNDPSFMETILSYASMRAAVALLEKGTDSVEARKLHYDKRSAMLNDTMTYWIRTTRMGIPVATSMIKRVAEESWAHALIYVTNTRNQLLMTGWGKAPSLPPEIAEGITAMSLALA